jgi:hypothetical protein
MVTLRFAVLLLIACFAGYSQGDELVTPPSAAKPKSHTEQAFTEHIKVECHIVTSVSNVNSGASIVISEIKKVVLDEKTYSDEPIRIDLPDITLVDDRRRTKGSNNPKETDHEADRN